MMICEEHRKTEGTVVPYPGQRCPWCERDEARALANKEFAQIQRDLAEGTAHNAAGMKENAQLQAEVERQKKAIKDLIAANLRPYEERDQLRAERQQLLLQIRDLWWLLENEPSGPGEGMVSTTEDVRLQKEWAEKYEMVRAGLPINPVIEKPKQECSDCGAPNDGIAAHHPNCITLKRKCECACHTTTHRASTLGCGCCPFVS